MTRYMMPARSQGKLYAQRLLAGHGTHRWVFVHSLSPDVDYAVRHWLLQRLNGFFCDLQAVYTPGLRRMHPTVQARTHVVLNNTPALPSMALCDEAVEVDACGLNARATVKALIKATGLNPHTATCGWPFCLDELDDATAGEGAQ